MRSGSDDLMRQSGYVTAAEVAAAVGQAVTSIKRAVAAGTIPGKTVPTPGGKYQRHYVEIRELLAAGHYAGNEVAIARLKALAELVPEKAAADPTTRAVSPRAPSRRGGLAGARVRGGAAPRTGRT